MKKIILLFIAIVGIIACGKSDDSSNNDGKASSSYAPPSWMIGTWVNELTNTTGYFVSDKDFCLISAGRTCLLSGTTAQVVTKISQKITNDTYEVSIEMNNGSQSIDFSFKKISDNKIAKLDLKGGVTDTFTKQ
ncbi:MAG: hypothetical protein Q3983_05220 [Capnocytophaga sp.]|nr:hypothetical protein [Capnocytophaga sp.]